MNRRFLVALFIPAQLCLASFAYGFEALPNKAPAPKDNPTTPGKVALGSKLYHDARLSVDGTVSCASCHSVMSSGTDNRPTSVGIRGQVGGRNAPTVLNAAFLSVQFWDGRAGTLEDQAKGPLTNPIEMGMPSLDAVVERIKSIPGYVVEFEKVFGKDSVNIDNYAKAVASFERTLITPDSPFDRHVKGDKKALSKLALEGKKHFEELGCTSCHSGAAFSGPALPEGVGFFQKFPVFPGSKYDTQFELLTDTGRFEATKKEEDKHFYRVPTLRNVAITAPYFHNGKVNSLEDAVQVMAKTQLNKELTPAQTKAIIAFLESLTGKIPEQKMPLLPHTAGKSLISAASLAQPSAE